MTPPNSPVKPAAGSPVPAAVLSALKRQVETAAGHAVLTPRDFERLSSTIFVRLHTLVSATTLKRLWGYIAEPVCPRRATLDVLARFVGYADLAHFEADAGDKADVQSNVTMAYSVSTAALAPGARLTLRWLPDRCCHVRYLGNNRFEVVEAENTKLAVGDTFSCLLMVEGEPLYLDALVHDGCPPVTYVAGRKDGIRIDR